MGNTVEVPEKHFVIKWYYVAFLKGIMIYINIYFKNDVYTLSLLIQIYVTHTSNLEYEAHVVLGLLLSITKVSKTVDKQYSKSDLSPLEFIAF